MKLESLTPWSGLFPITPWPIASDLREEHLGQTGNVRHATWGGWSMHLQSAMHWELKASRARDAAEMLSAEGAKATMLEMAKHYEGLARRAREIAAMLNELPANSSN